MSNVTEDQLRRLHEEQLVELRQSLDLQLSTIRARLEAGRQQEFERRVRELENDFRIRSEEARRKFEQDLAESANIKNPVLRASNEQFLRKSLASYLDFLKRMLDGFIAQWNN